MRVLMFGWEFPPHIAGGLGTACYGMTRGLAQHGVKVIFVMPKAYGDEDQQFVRVVNASDVETLYGDPKQKDIWEKMTFIHINSNMVPYISPEEFADYSEQVRNGGTVPVGGDLWKERYSFSGTYGANLMEEIARYAMVAAQLAKDLAGQFDVIHAHDWLTTMPASRPSAFRANRWWCTCMRRSSTAAVKMSTSRSTTSSAQAWRLPTA